MRGNCYVASEALFHILGGKATGWKPMQMRTKGDTPWWLQHRDGLILDPSVRQFGKTRLDYTMGRGGGFLTKHPSKRAVKLMQTLTWQED